MLVWYDSLVWAPSLARELPAYLTITRSPGFTRSPGLPLATAALWSCLALSSRSCLFRSSPRASVNVCFFPPRNSQGKASTQILSVDRWRQLIQLSARLSAGQQNLEGVAPVFDRGSGMVHWIQQAISRTCYDSPTSKAKIYRAPATVRVASVLS